LVIGDGAAFVAEHTDHFDAILIDSTDPVGAAVVLFSVPFYEACFNALRPGGVLVSQTGSPMYQGAELQHALANMRTVFPVVETYLGFVPTYPGVLWSFTSATKGSRLSGVSPVDVARRLDTRDIAPRFYTPDVHAASFALPTFVRDFVEATTATPLPRG
jgi:spermidine synthase